MPETPEQIYERASAALRMPPVEEWETFPFDEASSGHVRCNRPSTARSLGTARTVSTVGSCAAPDETYLWTNERWRLHGLESGPTGLPVIVILTPREHFAELSDLPDDLAAELGVLLARIERAVLSVGEIGRVHVCKWGDGGEHLHWWFMARPARIPQLMGSFAAIWDGHPSPGAGRGLARESRSRSRCPRGVGWRPW